jgi:hypothetical protein
MRILPALLFATTCAVLPMTAHAQQGDARIVDLAGTEATRADAPRKSAFGRVMDVMIGTLLQQHAVQDHAARTTTASRVPHQRQAFAADAVTSSPARGGRGPRKEAPTRKADIDISLGERFALPPANGIAATSGGPDSPE